MIRPALLLLPLACCFTMAAAQESAAPEPPHISPDGKFEFVQFTVEEANADKPPFGVKERATGKLIWSAPDDLGDATRPEEVIHWSPDSKRFALVSRVSTRRLGCYLFGWDGQTFSPLTWKDGSRLETLADAKVAAAAKAEGIRHEPGQGRVIMDDTLPERWVDANSLIVTRTMDVSVGGDEETVVSGVARVLLRWSAKKKEFSIARELGPREKP